MREADPTFICSAYKKNRYFMFTQREPVDPEDAKTIIAAGGSGRDVFNEKLNAGGQEIDSKGEGF